MILRRSNILYRIMTQEEVKNIVQDYNKRISISGNSLELVDLKDNNLKVKFTCLDKTEFKVQGKIVSMEDETKKSIEKYLKSKINNINIVFE